MRRTDLRGYRWLATDIDWQDEIQRSLGRWRKNIWRQQLVFKCFKMHLGISFIQVCWGQVIKKWLPLKRQFVIYSPQGERGTTSGMATWGSNRIDLEEEGGRSKHNAEAFIMFSVERSEWGKVNSWRSLIIDSFNNWGWEWVGDALG